MDRLCTAYSVTIVLQGLNPNVHFHGILIMGLHMRSLTDEEGREVSSVLSREIKEVLNDL